MPKRSVLSHVTALAALTAGLSVPACSQDLSIPYADVEPADGGAAGRASTSAKGGQGGSMTAGFGAGGRLTAGAAGMGPAGRAGAGSSGDSGTSGSDSNGGAGTQGGGAGSGGTAASGAGGTSGAAGSNPGVGGHAVGGVGSGGVGEGGLGGEPAGMGGAAGDGATAQPPELLFSEYVEGTGTFKALEIHALGPSSLEGCSVELYFNGNLEASSSHDLHGTLQPGAVSTLCSPGLAAELASGCNQTLNLNFNGDDAIALVCQDVVLDVIGQIGVDPGTFWGDQAVRTADRTLRRLCTVTAGDGDGIDAFDPTLEWQAFPVDTFDGLGALSCD